MQRFKAALPTGNYPGNPEALIRDNNGDFVLYEDVKKIVVDEQKKRWAEIMIKTSIYYHDNYERCIYCGGEGENKTTHKAGCIVVEAYEYLESLEVE